MRLAGFMERERRRHGRRRVRAEGERPCNGPVGCGNAWRRKAGAWLVHALCSGAHLDEELEDDGVADALSLPGLLEGDEDHGREREGGGGEDRRAEARR